MCGFCVEREDIYEKNYNFQKICYKLAFSRILNFQYPLNGSKVTIFSLLCTKKKFKNDQDICWLEHDYMEMKMIVRDQSKNYFHLTPKIGPLWGGGGIL